MEQTSTHRGGSWLVHHGSCLHICIAEHIAKRQAWHRKKRGELFFVAFDFVISVKLISSSIMSTLTQNLDELLALVLCRAP